MDGCVGAWDLGVRRWMGGNWCVVRGGSVCDWKGRRDLMFGEGACVCGRVARWVGGQVYTCCTRVCTHTHMHLHAHTCTCEWLCVGRMMRTNIL